VVIKVGRPAGEPLKPDNVNIAQQTTYGGYTTQPIQIGSEVYLYKDNKEKLDHLHIVLKMMHIKHQI